MPILIKGSGGNVIQKTYTQRVYSLNDYRIGTYNGTTFFSFASVRKRQDTGQYTYFMYGTPIYILGLRREMKPLENPNKIVKFEYVNGTPFENCEADWNWLVASYVKPQTGEIADLDGFALENLNPESLGNGTVVSQTTDENHTWQLKRWHAQDHLSDVLPYENSAGFTCAGWALHRNGTEYTFLEDELDGYIHWDLYVITLAEEYP